jgi:hypothetical protein
MTNAQGVRLEFSDGRAPLTSVADVNHAMVDVGSRVWPLDLHGAPSEVRRLLMQAALTEAEAERVKAHFLLPRQRLLEVIEGAGRKPHVPGGGELTTIASTHGYAYPQLWVVQNDLDYRRFDRFHVNAAEDGTGVDEVLQVLSGSRVMIVQRVPGGGVLTLHLDCSRQGAGWLVTYDGGNPHIGSLSRAEPGTKVLAQVIGPARWVIRYEDTV